MTKRSVALKLLGEVQSTKNKKGHGVNGFYTKPGVKAWFEDVAWQVKAQLPGHTPLVGEIRVVECTFYCKRTKDLDNLQNGLYDALQRAGVFEDDMQISEIGSMRRTKASPGFPPGVTISLREL